MGGRGAGAARGGIIVVVRGVFVVKVVVVVWRRRSRGRAVIVSRGVTVVPGVDATVRVFLAGRKVTVSWHCRLGKNMWCGFGGKEVVDCCCCCCVIKE